MAETITKNVRQKNAWHLAVAKLPPITDDERCLMMAGRSAARLHWARRSPCGLWPLDRWPAADLRDAIVRFMAMPSTPLLTATVNGKASKVDVSDVEAWIAGAPTSTPKPSNHNKPRPPARCEPVRKVASLREVFERRLAAA